MGRLAAWAAAMAIGVALLGSLVPIRGSNLEDTGVSVSCGPAFPAAMHWTGPPERGGETVMTGPDTAYTTSAWCEAEAGRWMVPAHLTAAALLAVSLLAVSLLAVSRVGRWLVWRSVKPQAPG